MSLAAVNNFDKDDWAQIEIKGSDLIRLNVKSFQSLIIVTTKKAVMSAIPGPTHAKEFLSTLNSQKFKSVEGSTSILGLHMPNLREVFIVKAQVLPDYYNGEMLTDLSSVPSDILEPLGALVEERDVMHFLACGSRVLQGKISSSVKCSSGLDVLAGLKVWNPNSYDATHQARLMGGKRLRKREDIERYITQNLDSRMMTISFPGGKLEPGETITDCAMREFREETGHSMKVRPDSVGCTMSYNSRYKQMNASFHFNYNVGESTLNEIVSSGFCESDLKALFTVSNKIIHVMSFNEKPSKYVFPSTKRFIHHAAKPEGLRSVVSLTKELLVECEMY